MGGSDQEKLEEQALRVEKKLHEELDMNPRERIRVIPLNEDYARIETYAHGASNKRLIQHLFAIDGIDVTGINSMRSNLRIHVKNDD